VQGSEGKMSERRGHSFTPHEFERLSTEEQLSRAHEFELRMRTRRTVRHFSPRRVPRELIETALSIASRAPSGANQQPWRFVVVLGPEIKRKIRIAAEAEERDNYERRFPHEWLDALAALGTDWHKDFLEIAPCPSQSSASTTALPLSARRSKERLSITMSKNPSESLVGF
jgi:iodotyrosine deiodinase